MSSLKYKRLAFVFMLWQFSIGFLLSQETSRSKSLPIPDDLKSQIRQSIDLGRQLYLQDKASAIGTDILMDKLVTLEDKGLIGYLSIQEGDEAGKLLPSWLVFFLTGVDSPKISYRIRVPLELGKKPELLESPVAGEHEQQILTLFRARQTAINAIQSFHQPINPVVVPAEAIGQSGILVELLAGTNKPDVVVLGKHYRVIVSEDGSKVRQIMPLSKEILELNKTKDAAALMVSQIVTDYPLETHVFASMLHGIDIYVVTQRGLWRVSRDSIVFLSSDYPENKSILTE